MDLLSNIAALVDETKDKGYGLHTLIDAIFISVVGTGGALMQ